MIFQRGMFGTGLKVLIFGSLLAVSAHLTAEQLDSEHSGYCIISLNPSFEKLSKSKVRMIYKGKVKHLNKVNIDLVDLSDKSPFKSEFYHLLLGKSLSQINGYRASLAFSGKGNIPQNIQSTSTDDIITWLKKNPNGIAYMPIELIPTDANVLYELKRKGN